MKKLMIVSVAGLSATLAWSAVTYTWDQSDPQTSFGDGDVTLTLDENGKITSLTAASGGEDIVFTGDRMTFAAGAVHTSYDRAIRYENDVGTEGGVSFTTGRQSIFVYAGGPVAAKGTTVVFQNVYEQLSDLDIVSGVLCGATSGEAAPYHVRRTDSEIVAQLQKLDSATLVKFVKIRLTKDGNNNILVEPLACGYVRDGSKLGADFDVEPFTELPVVADESSSSGYGLKGLTLKLRPNDAIVFAGAFDPAGTVTVDGLLHLELEDPDVKTLTAPFAGAGGLTIRAAADPYSEEKETFTVTTDTLPIANWLNWTVLAKNVDLSAVTASDLTATLFGGAYGGSVPSTASTEHFVNDGTAASCQFQGIPGSLKGVIVLFRQNGVNVEMKVDGAARYILSSNKPKIGDDISAANPLSVAYGGYTENNVYLPSLTLKAMTCRRTIVTMSPDVVNTWEGGTLAVSSSSGVAATYRTSSLTGWPRNGKVEIGAGGIVEMENSDAGGGGNVSIASGTSPIYVHAGGEFRQLGTKEFNCALHQSQRIFADGGTVWFGYGSTIHGPSSDPVNTGGSTYVGYLELSNGAHCRGSAVRAGFIVPEAFFAATGDGTSYFDTGISLVGATTKDNPDNMTLFRFHADEGATLEINGDVLPFSKFTNRRMTVRKTGGGVVRFNGQINFGNVTAEYNTQPATKLQEGLIELGVSSCGNANLAFSLDGGGIATAAGTTNALGLVTLTANGAIVLGDESELALADASGATWTAGARLNVTGDLKKSRLRFGTSASALTAAQLKCVRVNGNKAKLDDDGYVCEYVPGILLIVR